MANDGHEGLTKIAVAAPDGRIETVWAELFGQGRYRIHNLPFIAEGFALYDIAIAASRGRGDWPLLTDFVERSGHSCYRVALQDDQTFEGAFQAAWEPMSSIGCTYERFTARFAGINVPPATDVYEAYRLLEDGMASGVWWFDEIYVGHPPRSSSDIAAR